MDILDNFVPNDVALDIGSRVHHMNMQSVLKKIKDPTRVLASFVPRDYDEWIDLIDHNNLDCYSLDTNPISTPQEFRTLYRVFGREVKNAIYVSDDYIVGQMKWKGAWFYLKIENQACFIATNIHNFVSSLPSTLRFDLSL